MGFIKKAKQQIYEDAIRVQQNSQVAVQKPGDRIASVMARMYRLIVSVDLGLNSCYLECGEPKIGDTQLQVKGYYDSFFENLKNAFIPEDRERFTECFERKNLCDCFTMGRSFVCGIFAENAKAEEVSEDAKTTENNAAEPKRFEVRCERIPESERTLTKLRCCIYVREVTSIEDDGTPIASGENKTNEKPTEMDRILRYFCQGEYEINVLRGTIRGYTSEKNRFIRMKDPQNLSKTIETYISLGVIAPESAQDYRNLCRKDFLVRKTVGGTYSFYAKLKEPGRVDYTWFDECVVPLGGEVFRVYRRNIDEFKKRQDEMIVAEERNKYASYNSSMLQNVASLVEFRNVESGPHITHVQAITKILLKEITELAPDYKLTREQRERICVAAVLHDIGKITVPDYILNKPGRLTDEEFSVIKEHTINGARIIDRIKTDDMKELYDVCSDIALHHHEKYDGSGYPEHLKGEEISIGVQAVGIADVYDALVSERCYKGAYSHKEAMDMILGGECGAFNPVLIQALKNRSEDIRKIWEED